MPDWNKIKAEYIAGGVSYRELASRYGVSFSTLQRKATREKWTDLRSQADVKVESKLTDSVASHEAKRVDMFNTIADKLLQQINDNIDVYSTSTASMKDVSYILKQLREIKGIKSEADLREQEARIKKLEKECEEEANQTYTVVLNGVDDYIK